MEPLLSKEIPGYDGFYRIDVSGQVWTCRSGGGRYARNKKGVWKKLSHGVDLEGYHFVNLAKDGRSINHKVHHLVLNAFVGPCPPGHECRHFPDPDPSNNDAKNLQWGTKRQNADDRIAAGSTKGERNSQAKLTWEKVRTIRRLFATGKFSNAQLNVMFNVRSVSDVTSGATWRE